MSSPRGYIRRAWSAWWPELPQRPGLPVQGPPPLVSSRRPACRPRLGLRPLASGRGDNDPNRSCHQQCGLIRGSDGNSWGTLSASIALSSAASVLSPARARSNRSWSWRPRPSPGRARRKRPRPTRDAASRNSSNGRSASRTPRSSALRTSRPTRPWAVRCGTPRRIKCSISVVASRCPRSSRSAIAARFNSAPATSGAASSSEAPHRVERVEQRRLVFLQVAVVGQRQPFDQHQQRLQIADHAGRLAADQLQHVGVDLLRHDRRAGAERLRAA